jgi:ABC-type multidrug transport system ATPase subunit
LELSSCAHVKVGGDNFKGLSGGQRRRLSIALELLTQPRILYLDEPTTGLDSKTSLKLVSCLRKLANDRKTSVVCSINQPRADIFS